MSEFQMPDLRIEYLRPDELIPYERNTRVHTPTDIEQMCRTPWEGETQC